LDVPVAEVSDEASAEVSGKTVREIPGENMSSAKSSTNSPQHQVGRERRHPQRSSTAAGQRADD
jgi:hypothetical protein